jgi:phosphoglycerate dehydrogenase-like enzyme
VKIVFHFDGSAALAEKLSALGVELCPESDDAAFARVLPEVEVLWHVLKPVTAQVIERAPKLRLIQKIGSGVNTIDLETAKRRGIAVCNLPGTNSRAVAEMTLLLMLACLRRLPELHGHVKNGTWGKAWALQDHFGELAGRSVGLLGHGQVPRLLIPMLQAMGASVRYWSRSRRTSELDEIVGTSDIVSLHLPLTPETRGIVDPRRMKRGAILVNTARGGLVNADLLVAALTTHHLAAAGLDVFADEPVDASHPLLALENTVCTPHLAWLTRETLERSIAAALDNVIRLANDRPLANRVA